MDTTTADLGQIRILIAEDDAFLRDLLAQLLEPFCRQVETVSDGDELLAVAPELDPDLLVVDIAMPGVSGLDAAPRLLERLPHAKLIFLTADDNPAHARRALRAGASGYLLKRTSVTNELFHAIREALAHRIYVTPVAQRKIVLPSEEEKGSAELTERQREVLRALASGQTMKGAAAELELTPRTIAYHKYRIMEKLGCASNAELMRYAFQEGLVS